MLAANAVSRKRTIAIDDGYCQLRLSWAIGVQMHVVGGTLATISSRTRGCVIFSKLFDSS